MTLTMADTTQAENWVNDIMGKALADDWACTRIPGAITFYVRAEYYPEIASLRTYAQAKLTARLGSPATDVGSTTVWRLTATRSVTLWSQFMNSDISITLVDNEPFSEGKASC